MLKEKIISGIDKHKELLINVAKEIHNNPELGFKEYIASKLLTDELQKAGFTVELGVAGLDTAIYAVHPDQKEGPTVAIFAVYDALPEIDHACGHNLIAAAALGASLGLGEIKSELPGTLIFMGTPAEEGGGGKIYMIDAGLFKTVDAAMMFHPSSIYNMIGRRGLAVTRVNIEFQGESSHASSQPEKGINALDAVIQTFNGINALRQHIKQDARLHGIITHGGIKPNIVPEYASASFYIRALDTEYCEELLTKVENCAKGAALSTGAKLTFTKIGLAYKARRVNRNLGEAFLKNLTILQVPNNPMPEGKGLGSSDIGNVSYEVPTIHPYLGISETDISSHSPIFEKASISDKGHESMLNAAKALAMTALDVLTNPELVTKMKEEFHP